MIAIQKLLDELFQRQHSLTMFGLAMFASMVPTLVAVVIDDRAIRDVGVWAKPLKFMASTGLFALTTAWFMGLLPESVRSSTGSLVIAWTLILTSLFEVAYITFQSALGSRSHYNVDDPFHAAMFGLMALAAILLTATQAALAWQIAMHAPRPYSVETWAVMAGLLLTFSLGTFSGFMLGGNQPPVGVGLAIVGWHMQGGDIRPAHFLGVHAQQIVPLAGLVLQRSLEAHAGMVLILFVAAYLACWIFLAALGLRGV
jgi:hypothetical protein